MKSKRLVYFIVIWNILRPFGPCILRPFGNLVAIWYVFPVLVYFVKKYLATLRLGLIRGCLKTKSSFCFSADEQEAPVPDEEEARPAAHGGHVERAQQDLAQRRVLGIR
jgi:hypothetical protein